MNKRGFAVASIVLLVASGCTQQPERRQRQEAPESQSFRVQIDGETDAFNGAFTAFFPKELRVHGGDTIRFEMPHSTGEPHTVTFGTLVDAAVAKIERLGGPQPGLAEEGEPEVAKVVDVFPHQPGEGPPQPNQSAAQPCFLDSGDPPGSLTGGAPACPKRSQPEFNGRQSFYNSGLLLDDGSSFRVRLANDIEPGTYNFMCVVHRAAMTGKINVVDSDTRVESPAEVTAKGRRQLEQVVDKLRPEADKALQGPADKPQAGIGAEGVHDALIAEFGPKEISVQSGSSITWQTLLFHTLAFNASEDDVGIFRKEPDGSFRFNLRTLAPERSGGLPPEYFTFPQPVKTPVTVDGGNFDGSGFKSSGILASIPPALVSYRVTFTRPGTFEFRCLLHPDMKSRVTVT